MVSGETGGTGQSLQRQRGITGRAQRAGGTQRSQVQPPSLGGHGLCADARYATYLAQGILLKIC